MSKYNLEEASISDHQTRFRLYEEVRDPQMGWWTLTGKDYQTNLSREGDTEVKRGRHTLCILHQRTLQTLLRAGS